MHLSHGPSHREWQTGYKLSSVNVCKGFSIYTGKTEFLTKNCGKTSQEPVLDQMRRKWNWIGHTLRRNDDSITKQALQWTPCTRPQRKRATKEYLEKSSEERNVDSRIQVQPEEDGGSSTNRNWVETSGLWPIFHRERQSISQVSHTVIENLQSS